MNDNKQAGAECGCHKETDRYLSFDGIDCNGNASLVMRFIERNLAGSDTGQPVLALLRRQTQTPQRPAAGRSVFGALPHQPDTRTVRGARR